MPDCLVLPATLLLKRLLPNMAPANKKVKTHWRNEVKTRISTTIRNNRHTHFE